MEEGFLDEYDDQAENDAVSRLIDSANRLRSDASAVVLPSALRINIIGKSNGVGLARDMRLLEEALRSCGHEVSTHAVDTVQIRRRRSLLSQSLVGLRRACRKFGTPSRGTGIDISLMVEHVWPQFISQASCNVVVPNPEWFDRNDLRFLPWTDGVWAKTQLTAQIFRGLGRPTTFIGFDSDDRYQPQVPRERRFFHLAGKSAMKSTERLVRLWASQPQWPTLTIVQHSPHLHAPEVRAANIDRRCGYMDDEELKREQNACMFHVCPSLTEGWGHYLVEALSVGAVALTVDAPPMNELVTPDRGLLVSYEATGRQKLARTYYFSNAELRNAVESALTMTDARWRELSLRARAWFEANRAGFPERVRTALSQLA